MDNLIARLEAAEEGSRELDAAIRFEVFGDMTRCNYDEGCYCGDAPHEGMENGCGKWLGVHDERRSYPQDWREDERLPHYTKSTDAALTLVPEGRWHKRLFDWSDEGLSIVYELWPLEQQPDGSWQEMYYGGTQNIVMFKGKSRATPALAMSIASLKARKADG